MLRLIKQQQVLERLSTRFRNDQTDTEWTALYLLACERSVSMPTLRGMSENQRVLRTDFPLGCGCGCMSSTGGLSLRKYAGAYEPMWGAPDE
jgi:hypothetical protein